MRFLLSGAALLVGALSVPNANATVPVTLGDAAPIEALFPEARDLPAPDWLVPGTRVSYDTISAVQGGGAAGGLVQYDVIATTNDRVMIYALYFGDSGSGTALSGVNSAAGYPGVGPFWIHPSVLVNAEAKAEGNLSVVRTQRNGLDIVRFQYQGATEQSVYEYDTVNGVRVFNGQTAATAESQEGYRSTRTLPLPWSGQAPNWVQAGTQLLYSGVQTNVTPSATVPRTMAYTVDVANASAAFSLMNLTVDLETVGQNQGSLLNGGSQAVGAYWLSNPAMSADLPAAETLLDTDPITGAETLIHREGNEIVLQMRLPAFAWTGVYDELLALTRFASTTVAPLAQTTEELTLVGGTDLAAVPPRPSDPEPEPTADDDVPPDDDIADDDVADDDTPPDGALPDDDGVDDDAVGDDTSPDDNARADDDAASDDDSGDDDASAEDDALSDDTEDDPPAGDESGDADTDTAESGSDSTDETPGRALPEIGDDDSDLDDDDSEGSDDAASAPATQEPGGCQLTRAMTPSWPSVVLGLLMLMLGCRRVRAGCEQMRRSRKPGAGERGFWTT